MSAAAASPALTAGQAVASAFGHQARASQMTEALVAVRPIIAGLQHAADHQVTRALALIDAALTASPVKEVRYGRWMITLMKGSNHGGRGHLDLHPRRTIGRRACRRCRFHRAGHVGNRRSHRGCSLVSGALHPPGRPGPKPRPLAQRLAAKIEIDPVSGCHNWTGAVNDKGYGRICAEGDSSKLIGTHTAAFELAKGPLPEGMEPDHLCKNTRCCNAEHMEAVTGLENILRSDGPSALNARKTHCAQGHPFSEENTYRKPSAPRTRNCRICQRQRNARRKAERAARDRRKSS